MLQEIYVSTYFRSTTLSHPLLSKTTNQPGNQQDAIQKSPDGSSCFTGRSIKSKGSIDNCSDECPNCHTPIFAIPS